MDTRKTEEFPTDYDRLFEDEHFQSLIVTLLIQDAHRIDSYQEGNDEGETHETQHHQPTVSWCR